MCLDHRITVQISNNNLNDDSQNILSFPNSRPRGDILIGNVDTSHKNSDKNRMFSIRLHKQPAKKKHNIRECLRVHYRVNIMENIYTTFSEYCGLFLLNIRKF